MLRPEGRRPGARRLGALVAVLAVLVAGCAAAEQPSAAPDGPTPQPPPAETAPPVDDAPPDEDRDLDGDRDPDPDAADVEPAPDPPVQPEVDRPDLRTALDPLLRTTLSELSDAELGVLVVDPTGTELLANEPDRPLLPASTLKLVTAAAMLVTLGPEARLDTRLETTAPVDDDGVVRGDLQLVGTGDPMLATPEYGRWIYPARPRTRLEALADDLEDMGVRRITGDVVGRADGFAGPPRAEGWPERYFSDFNARRITGLTVDAGVETQVTWPEEEATDQDPAEEEPAEDEADGDTDPGKRDAAERGPLRGDRTDIEPEAVRIEHADDPVAHATGELVRLLEERKIEVGGRARTGQVEAPVLGTLARVESPSVAQMLRFMVQRSDNHIADTLLHVAGRVRTGEGSWERGERGLLQVLDHLDVPREGLRLADGSGLSRRDRLTARSLVELDLAMVHGRHGGVWESLMAVAGEPGTLSHRLRATPAQGRLLAKTGSLRDVVSLSGFVRGDDGQRHHFAVLANEATGADRAVVRAFVDDLALVLSADLLACDVEPADGRDDGPLGRPPLAVAC